MWKVKRRHTDRELVLFSQQLGQLLTVGFGLLGALEIIERRGSGSKRMKRDIRLLLQQLEQGATFSSVLKRIRFPPFYCFLILAAEFHGRYAEALHALALYYEQRRKRKSKLLKVFAYPTLVLLTSFGCLLFIARALIPQLASLYESFAIELPWFTTQLLLFSAHQNTFTVLLIVFLAAVSLVVFYALKKHRLRCEFGLLRIPIVSSFTKTSVTTLVLKQMGYLLDSGAHVLDICDLFEEESHWKMVSDSFGKVKLALLSGKTLSEAFEDVPFLHPITIEAVHIFEQSGNLAVGMLQLAQQLEEEHQQRLELLSSFVEVQTALVAGIFVFIIILALFLPMFDFIQHI
ncbi:hypothetical protein BEP19_00835 [Ammoniphilus oxalaticus]|uniref:Type II secretion system protein GspF domain-containing protein n=1 Tax=Ammoniphilus oxalaticus TaxID=66863 RepID=A0A419SMQ6_9BACL|nr:type II secretion system F family protein [Ammoniphilus oxalaticus]RKD25523.1 hypothetical protein BEP19_00835 [Ammoniphilus oxalaticus]